MKVRMQLDVTLEAAARLDCLVVLTGSVSRAEVIRRALALYDRVLTASANGGEVRIVEPGKPDVALVV